MKNQETLDKIAAELKELRENPKKFEPTEKQKSDTKASWEIYEKQMSDIPKYGWVSLKCL